MPELPEVETIKNDLLNKVVGHKIIEVDFLWPGILKEIGAGDFIGLVSGKKIIGVTRRAKNLYLTLEDDLNILMHMKMTGHLIVTSDDWKVDSDGRWITNVNNGLPLADPLNQYIRAIFYLDKGKILAFSDLRKFAYLKLLDTVNLEFELKKYGPEPLGSGFTIDYLFGALKNKKLAIKKFLMDPKNVAGIGNIYADEILWQAKVHPLRAASSITKAEAGLIHEATIEILEKSISLRGTSTSDFRDASGKKGLFGNELKVYQKTNSPCFRDGMPIRRIVVGGRGTHFCPKCQKEDT